MPGDGLGRLGDGGGFLLLPQFVGHFSVAAAMATDVGAAVLDARDAVGAALADQAVEQDGRRQPELIEQTEDAPDPAPQPVVAPGVVALGLRPAALGGIGAAAGEKGE